MSKPPDIRVFTTGPTQTNTYVLRDGDDAWVIDPGYGPDAVLEFLDSEDVRPSRVVLTHGHCDHLAGVEAVRAARQAATVCCPEADADMLLDAAANLSSMFGLPVTVAEPFQRFAPGQTLTLGETAWQVLDTSGHTPGGVSLYCPDEAVAFTGDALFAGGIGRTDFPGGDQDRLLRTIRENLLTLPDETRILPGHGPASTIGRERQGNPFLR